MISGDMITTKHGYHEPRQVSPFSKIILFFIFVPIKVKILFDEYFFNSEDKSYQVLCIDQPLEGGVYCGIVGDCEYICVFFLATNEHSFSLTALETLQDCMQFLWYDPSESSLIFLLSFTLFSLLLLYCHLSIGADKIKRSVDSLLGSFKYDGLATTVCCYLSNS